MNTRLSAQHGPLNRVFDVCPTVALSVQGVSMLPFAPPGSSLHCRRPRVDEPLEHRIVVAKVAHRHLAHRVIASWNDANGEAWLRMRGDNSAGCEDVRRSDVIAVVDAIDMGGVRIPLHRLSARVEGALGWMGRQVVFLPRRMGMMRARMRAE